jgi:hypothetical protein
VTPANYRQGAIGHNVSEQVHLLELIGNNLQSDAAKLLRRAP